MKATPLRLTETKLSVVINEGHVLFCKLGEGDLPYCRALSVTRRRIPGFIACAKTNEIARSPSNNGITLYFMLITSKRELSEPSES